MSQHMPQRLKKNTEDLPPMLKSTCKQEHETIEKQLEDRSNVDTGIRFESTLLLRNWSGNQGMCS